VQEQLPLRAGDNKADELNADIIAFVF